MDDRRLFTGLVIAAACACGTSAGLASIAGLSGSTPPSGIFYSAILVTGSLIFLLSFYRQRAGLLPATLGVMFLWTAGLLAPPRIMRDGYAFTSWNVVGFVLYLVATGLILWALLRRYRPAEPAAAALAFTGAGLAAGCPCCLTAGALKFLAVEGVGAPWWMVSRTGLLLPACTLVAAGLLRSGAPRASFGLLALGAIVIFPVQRGVEWLVPVWEIYGANITFLLRYPVWLIGTALLFYAARLSLGDALRGRGLTQAAPELLEQPAPAHR